MLASSSTHLGDMLGVWRLLDGVGGSHEDAKGALLLGDAALQAHVASLTPGSSPGVLHQPVRLALLVLHRQCPPALRHTDRYL